MKPKTTYSAIGLDIGNHSIKCVELLHSKERFTLERAIVLPLGEQSPDNLTLLLKPIVEILKASPDHLRMIFSGSSLLVRCVSMPIMSQAELKNAIRFEAENHIAFPIDDCVLDFQIVNQSQEAKTMNVLLVAAKRDFIQERLKQLFDLELRPEVIDVDTFALVNAFTALGPDEHEKVFGLLNVGHRVTSFAIVDGGLPLFVRQIPMGGAAVTKALADSKGIGEAEAERFKLDPPQGSEEEVLTATHHALEPLAEEIKNSITFYENSSGENFKTIWISGGAALGKDAVPFFSEALGKEVVFWDNLAKLEMGRSIEPQGVKEVAGLLNVALGMAVRG